MPSKLPPIEYPDRFEVRYVSAKGGIRWNKAWVNVSTTCVGEYVGLEEIDDGVWNVYFGALKLGRLLERKMKIEDAYRSLYRQVTVTHVPGLMCHLSPRPLSSRRVSRIGLP